jgi:RsbT co-antagonist protein rsbRD N-terminal domain
VKIEVLPWSAALANRRNAVVKRWFERMLQSYPESMTGFLSHESDPFRNPVGHTLKEGLSALFDGLIQAPEVASLKPVLDGIVRVRAVQDFTASQAVSFPFLLKQILRAEFTDDSSRYSDELAALEARIDELALLAFDLYMECREQVFEIRANETKRRSFILERAHQRGWSSP